MYEQSLQNQLFKNGQQLSIEQAKGVAWLLYNYVNNAPSLLVDGPGCEWVVLHDFLLQFNWWSREHVWFQCQANLSRPLVILTHLWTNSRLEVLFLLQHPFLRCHIGSMNLIDWYVQYRFVAVCRFQGIVVTTLSSSPNRLISTLWYMMDRCTRGRWYVNMNFSLLKTPWIASTLEDIGFAKGLISSDGR